MIILHCRKSDCYIHSATLHTNLWALYSNYGPCIRIMGLVFELWALYSNYGPCIRIMGLVFELWALYSNLYCMVNY